MQLTDKQKKYGLIAIGVIVIGAGAYYIHQKTKSSSPGAAASDPTGNGTVTNPTLPTQTFNPTRIADDLYNAMKSSGYASFLNPNERDQIFKALESVKTEAQFQQVSDKFGLKSYNTTYGNQINFNPFSSLPLKPPKVWLEIELEYEDYFRLKKKYPNKL